MNLQTLRAAGRLSAWTMVVIGVLMLARSGETPGGSGSQRAVPVVLVVLVVSGGATVVAMKWRHVICRIVACTFNLATAVGAIWLVVGVVDPVAGQLKLMLGILLLGFASLNTAGVLIAPSDVEPQQAESPPSTVKRLKVKCPKCRRELKGATAEMVGDLGVCPKCKTEFTITDDEGR